MKNFLQTLVLPKLKADVDSWNPRIDPLPLHSWLHPWLPLAANDMEDLYPVIRYKIGVALAEWHPSDMSALTILRPWAKVFKPQVRDVVWDMPVLAFTLRIPPTP